VALAWILCSYKGLDVDLCSREKCILMFWANIEETMNGCTKLEKRMLTS